MGKNGYALAFGASGLSKLLLYNDAGQGSPNPMDGIMRKSVHPDDSKSRRGEVVVPRDFMIKTAYVRKRRPGAQETQSVRSRQSSTVSVFSKQSQHIN